MAREAFVSYWSPYPPEECLRRISAAARLAFHANSLLSPYTGRIHGDTVTLRRKSLQNHPRRHVLRVVVHEEPEGGALVLGSLTRENDKNPVWSYCILGAVLLGLAALFHGGILVADVSTLYDAVRQGLNRLVTEDGLYPAIAMLLGIVLLERRQLRHDDVKLRAFLVRELRLTPLDPGTTRENAGLP